MGPETTSFPNLGKHTSQNQFNPRFFTEFTLLYSGSAVNL